jgi:hypothetical protein
MRLAPDHAKMVSARLLALTRAAQIFGSALSGVDIEVDWSLAPGSQRAVWFNRPDGRRAVNLRLDLNRVIGLLGPAGEEEENRYAEVFRAGFLYELGHILYSSRAPSLPIEKGRARVVQAVWKVLEDARVERHLMLKFRGARRYLAGHAKKMAEVASNEAEQDSLTHLLAVLFLQIWGAEDMLVPAGFGAKTAAITSRLRDSLQNAVEQESNDALACWVIGELLPLLDDYMDLDGEEEEQKEESDSGDGKKRQSREEPEEEDQREEQFDQPETERGTLDSDAQSQNDLYHLAEQIEEKLASPLVFPAKTTVPRQAGDKRDEAVRPCIILYPHVDGGMLIDEVPVAQASEIARTGETEGVLHDFTQVWGPRAIDAFATEAAALRRAFQVNFEARYSGRYRSGRHIGMSNLRRFLLDEDLRLFQRIERPQKLSYYFHLLLDVSPSMLTNRNLQKALAVGYAFAELLELLRVPVDVTLYSSALTELHVHGRGSLERFFGGHFGYLSSGTHEIEAIAYAKRQADRVSQERKIFVVTTDGQPNSEALGRTGARDLRTYYQGTLIPWLENSGIDLLAIALGRPARYHRNTVTISAGWQSLGVFVQLLHEIIARGSESHSALWT